MVDQSSLQKERQTYSPKLPPALVNIAYASILSEDHSSSSVPLPDLFPKTRDTERMVVRQESQKLDCKPHRVGVVLSGGQAAGGHNVIVGLFDALQQRNPQSRLYGFLNGPKGILNNEHIELRKSCLEPYRNQGGFDLIGSGRDKIETEEQFAAARKTVVALQLDGLVIIGGDDSNTNAALLAEYFAQNSIDCKVIGVPKTIDGDLRSEDVEMSFGFDTAAKTYSETISAIARDTLSAKKYYHFIRLMGRSASHLTLECALQTHPNVTLISEEVSAQKWTVRQITEYLSDVICARAKVDKNYGVVLIPEGILEFIPETKALIKELNRLLNNQLPHEDELRIRHEREEKVAYVKRLLKGEALSCYEALPLTIQTQLLLDRDPHGNVQVSKIETERLFMDTVKDELLRRTQEGRYSSKFSAQGHFLGYEGRSCFPSNFDANYCYALGGTAATLMEAPGSGYIAFVRHLAKDVSQWEAGGAPLAPMIHLEERKGKPKPVIRKAVVDLEGQAFQSFQSQREKWAVEDAYHFVGPIQFYGPPHLTDSVPLTLVLEKRSRAHALA